MKTRVRYLAVLCCLLISLLITQRLPTNDMLRQPIADDNDVDTTVELTWFSVDDGHLFTMSAYYDTRQTERNIRVIGIIRVSYQPGKLYCHMKNTDESLPLVVPAVVMVSYENHGLRYTSCVITCPISEDSLPIAIAMATSVAYQPANWTEVTYSKTEFTRFNFTVCVTPLNYNFDNYYQLVEMIEVNRLFGADHFVFYNHSSGCNVSKYLSRLALDTTVEVVQWRIPVRVDQRQSNVVPEIHYFGQVAALNECLYRCMFSTKYVVFTDLDEIIVPKNTASNWFDIVHTGANNETGSFVISSSFFMIEYPDEGPYQNNSLVRKWRIQTVRKTRRERKLWPHFRRSKCIVVPKRALTTGVHEIDKFVRPYRHYLVDKRTALLHHYRTVFDVLSAENLLDNRMLDFADEIINRVAERHRIVNYSKL